MSKILTEQREEINHVQRKAENLKRNVQQIYKLTKLHLDQIENILSGEDAEQVLNELGEDKNELIRLVNLAKNAAVEAVESTKE